MGVLVLGPELEAEIERVVQFARQKANWYRVGTTIIPGDDDRYCLTSGHYRAVFSWTETKEGLYRHLSVSVGDGRMAPSPIAVWTLAHMFGFTGAKPDPHGMVQRPSLTWKLGVEEPAIVLAERILDA